MKSIAIESAPIGQWKSEFINKLKEPGFFNSTFTGLNSSEITKIIQEIPTDQEEFMGQLFKLPEEVMLPIFKSLLVKFSSWWETKGFIAELAGQLFKLPPDVLHPLITTHGAKLIKESGLSQKVFIEKLFELPAEVLQPILTKDLLEIMKIPHIDIIGGFTKQFFKLPAEVLLPVLTDKPVELLKAGSSYGLKFIEKFFKLPAEVLLPVLTDKPVELLKASSSYGLKFIEKLFELPAEVLQPILTEHVPELMSTNRDIQGFTEQLFKLPVEVLRPVLTDKSVELLKVSSPYFKQFIEKLFELPTEVLQPILTEHVLEIMNTNSSIPDFMEKLFKLPTEVLRPVLTDKSVELLKASSPYGLKFIEKLFELPVEALVPVLTENALELLNVYGLEQKMFIQKLNELPEEDIKSIFTQDNLTKFFAKHAAGSMNLGDDDLYTLFQQHKLTMPIVAMERMTFKTDSSMGILKFTPAAISLINNIEALHPTIRKILEKTYFQMEEGKKEEFLNNWVQGLKKIIESNESIAMILEKTVDVTGDIFMVNSNVLPGTTGISGFCRTDTLNIYVATERNINEALATLVHESTHKLIQITHNNDALPYAKGATFEEMERAIAEELELEKKLNIHASIKSGSGNALNINSWLTRIMDNYPTEKIAIELLPHLTGQITESILKGEAIEAVSKTFANLVWTYLHEQLHLSSELPVLPKLSCHSFELIDDIELGMIDEVTKILASGDPTHNWFDSDAGKLAFKALSYVQKDSYIKQLFELPEDELGQIFVSHITPLIECSGDNKLVLVYELSKLSLEALAPAIMMQPIGFLESLGAENVWSVLPKLEQLSGEQLLPLFEINPPKFLEACAACKSSFIYKLLELPSEMLLPILATYGEELIKMDGGAFEYRYMQKFKDLNLDTSAYSFTIASPNIEEITFVYTDLIEDKSYFYNVMSVLEELCNQNVGSSLPKEWVSIFEGYIQQGWDM